MNLQCMSFCPRKTGLPSGQWNYPSVGYKKTRIVSHKSSVKTEIDLGGQSRYNTIPLPQRERVVSFPPSLPHDHHGILVIKWQTKCSSFVLHFLLLFYSDSPLLLDNVQDKEANLQTATAINGNHSSWWPWFMMIDRGREWRKERNKNKRRPLGSQYLSRRSISGSARKVGPMIASHFLSFYLTLGCYIISCDGEEEASIHFLHIRLL